ncbi:DNA-binding protein D-ETS-4 isoform X1 [Plutella xylostella]|uniref:DNA-binding protein D-ETS-4 isoform X1 n=2 Tax=Plutella xylostella TaxID=51655 RepID=UPI0005D06698|nr:DNA-binding protein D-ETS-4 isoform X1 [Plutella xylostella]
MLWEPNLLEETDAMPQTVPRSGSSPAAAQGERAVPASPSDLQQLLRLLGAPPSPDHMPLSPPAPHKPPPPYPDHHDTTFLDRLYDFESYPTPSPSSDEGSIPTVALQPPSPYSSIQYSPNIYIKEEPNRLSLHELTSPYPLSPSGSCASYSSQRHPSPAPHLPSPAPHHDEYIDIEELLKENQILQEQVYLTPKRELDEGARDHALLRTALEDTSFQRRFNLKPVPLELGSVKMEESSGGVCEDSLANPDIDKVLSMAIEQSKRDVDNTCTVLGISPDPMQWSSHDVKAWVMFTLQHYQLPLVPADYFCMDGPALVALTEDEFNQRAPQAGSTLYAQLEIWKASRHEAWRSMQWPEPAQQLSPNPKPAGLPSADDMSDEEDVESPSAAPPGKAKSGSTHIHLWQFLKELLASPQLHGSAIRWLDRSNGVFKIEDSVRVARLWGKRKNRPAMNYDKLSRSIRQYYKKGIMKKTERSQRLVYQFCHPYCL